jgi:hypothetical protein
MSTQRDPRRLLAPAWRVTIAEHDVPRRLSLKPRRGRMEESRAGGYRFPGQGWATRFQTSSAATPPGEVRQRVIGHPLYLGSNPLSDSDSGALHSPYATSRPPCHGSSARRPAPCPPEQEPGVASPGCRRLPPRPAHGCVRAAVRSGGPVSSGSDRVQRGLRLGRQVRERCRSAAPMTAGTLRCRRPSVSMLRPAGLRRALNRRWVRRRRLGRVQATSAVLAYEASQNRLGAVRAPAVSPPIDACQALGPRVQRTHNRRPVSRHVVPLLLGGGSPPAAKSTHRGGIGMAAGRRIRIRPHALSVEECGDPRSRHHLGDPDRAARLQAGGAR